MPEIVADPPLPPCYLLISRSGVEEDQRLAPDLFFACARTRNLQGFYEERSAVVDSPVCDASGDLFRPIVGFAAVKLLEHAACAVEVSAIGVPG